MLKNLRGMDITDRKDFVKDMRRYKGNDKFSDDRLIFLSFHFKELSESIGMDITINPESLCNKYIECTFKEYMDKYEIKPNDIMDDIEENTNTVTWIIDDDDFLNSMVLYREYKVFKKKRR